MAACASELALLQRCTSERDLEGVWHELTMQMWQLPYFRGAWDDVGCLHSRKHSGMSEFFHISSGTFT